MTRRDMAKIECTRDPIFLFQWRSNKKEEWRTETVFLARAEGEAFGTSHSYRWKHWRVYCVPASGNLAELLRRQDPDGDRMQGRLFD